MCYMYYTHGLKNISKSLVRNVFFSVFFHRLSEVFQRIRIIGYIGGIQGKCISVASQPRHGNSFNETSRLIINGLREVHGYIYIYSTEDNVFGQPDVGFELNVNRKEYP